ncbi:uncharacterized protein BKCO1_2000090 [Diplodia corticola]|uniref:DUF7730 domain-containing protein n=1 Tax=Diplodia corticola TaxID=236234 RepID=A0A1J9R2M3_9PEZI|nr:uncharacterized protein BKCO1_2000090 [Diplodia corticola]OJD34864.1 hypothetical protein BKCO1_2000090 [Diplodia corticola]
MSSKRERYLFRPLYRGVVKPVGMCLLAPLVVMYLAYYACRKCGSYSHRTPLDSRSHLDSQREFEQLCEKLDRDYTPPPLLANRRPRALTICEGVVANTADVEEKQSGAPPANPQHQSLFFTRLPPELRLRIYHYVLGGNVIHLLLKPGRVGHVVCTGDPSVVRAPGDPDRRCIAAHAASREILYQRRHYPPWNHQPGCSCCSAFALDDPSYRIYSTHHRAHDGPIPKVPDCMGPSPFVVAPPGRPHHRLHCPRHHPPSLHNHLLPSILLPGFPFDPDHLPESEPDHPPKSKSKFKFKSNHPPKSDYHDFPNHYHDPPNLYPSNPPNPTPSSHSLGLLPLLLTCRAAYRESVATLYAANLFDANHPQTLVLFARATPPRRLASVRALQLRWSWRLRERPGLRAPGPIPAAPGQQQRGSGWWGEWWGGCSSSPPPSSLVEADRADGVEAGAGTGTGAGAGLRMMTGLQALYLSLELEGTWDGTAQQQQTAQQTASVRVQPGEEYRVEEEQLLRPIARNVRGLRKLELTVEVEGSNGRVKKAMHRPSRVRETLAEIVCAPRGGGMR